MQRKIKKTVTAVVSLCLCLFFSLDTLWIFEYRLQDALFQRGGMVHPDILVIGIDDHTLETFGPFHTWSRTLVPQAIEILNSDPDARPAVIGVDVLYIDPAGETYDALLFEAVSGTDNVLMASHLEIGLDPQSQTLDASVLRHWLPLDPMLPYVEVGFVNATIDRDSVIRSTTLRVDYYGGVAYAFASVAAAMYLGVEPAELFPEHLNETLIRYTGYPGDFFELSLADVFEPWFEPTWFADAVVLIGPYAMGMMDHHAVSIDLSIPMYGVEIHANVVQQLIEQNFVTRLDRWFTVAISIVFVLVIMLLGEHSRLGYMLGAIGILMPSYFALAFGLYYQGWLLPIASPLVAIGLAGIYQLIYAYVLSSIERNKIRNTLKKYVDPKLAEVLIHNPQVDSEAVGQKQHIAIMFVDIRGFTPLTESLQDKPEVIVQILNEYLELTSSSVFDNGGSVDKFIGDATMALFNGFVPLDDYIYKAVKAAWNIVEHAEALNTRIKEVYGVELGFGVGVNCGEAIVGNLGPSFRKDYTAIGDAVNTAARLESTAKASQVIISQSVYETLQGRITVETLGAVPLKGKKEPQPIYALRGIEAAS